MRSVPRALTAGVAPVRNMPQTIIGKILPLPMVKEVKTKSSSETAKNEKYDSERRGGGHSVA